MIPPRGSHNLVWLLLENTSMGYQHVIHNTTKSRRGGSRFNWRHAPSLFVFQEQSRGGGSESVSNSLMRLKSPVSRHLSHGFSIDWHWRLPQIRYSNNVGAQVWLNHQQQKRPFLVKNPNPDCCRLTAMQTQLWFITNICCSMIEWHLMCKWECSVFSEFAAFCSRHNSILSIRWWHYTAL